jgi:hypothetical protein
VTHLQGERPITERVTSLDTLAAAVAEFLIDCVFIVRVFDEGAFDGAGGTKLIFRRFGDIERLRPKEAETYPAVPTECVSVNALNGRFFQDAVRGAITAGDTGIRVDLPYGVCLLASGTQQTRRHADTRRAGSPGNLPHEAASGHFVPIFRHQAYSLILLWLKVPAAGRICQGPHSPDKFPD